MKSLRRIFVYLLAAVCTIVAVTIFMGAGRKKENKAPDFKLPTLEGKQVDLKTLQKSPTKKGKKQVIVLDFWATWCHFCVEEIPTLNKLEKDFKKQGARVVGISLDEGGAKDVKAFMKTHKVDYTILTNTDNKVAKKYNVRGLPTCFVIDRNGVIRYTHVGFEPGLEKTLRKEIKTLLK